MRCPLLVVASLTSLALSAQTYRLATVAKLGTNGDGGPATQATLLYPRGVAVARDGAVYVSENGTNRVRRVAPNGIITTYAGTGVTGFGGDGGPATQAKLNGVTDLAVDPNGNLYMLDANNGRVRRVGADGIIQTVAGKGGCGFNKEGPAMELQFCTIAGLALDPAGTLYISEEDGVTNNVGHRVWKVDAKGNATIAAGPQDGLEAPTSIAVDRAGNIYIHSLGYIYRKNIAGTVETITGAQIGSGNSVQIGSAKNAYIGAATALAVGPDDNLYFSTGFGFFPSAVFVVMNGNLNLVAGMNQYNSSGYDGDNGILLWQPGALAFDASGSLFISDYNNHRVRRFSNGTFTTIAGTRTLPPGSVAPSFQLGAAQAIAAPADGNFYYADFAFAQVRKISPNGQVSVFAGNGTTPYSGDGGPALSAGLGGGMNTLAFDPAGNFYVHSYGSYRVREVTTDGTIRTAVGTGRLSSPVADVFAVAADTPGILYYTDLFGLHRVSQGTSTVLYPSNGIYGLALSPSGVLHFLYSGQVFRLDNGTPTLVAGGSKPAKDGDPALGASLGFPSSMAFDSAGNLYLAGTGVWRIGTDGILHQIVAGADGAGSPDGTPAATAAIPNVLGIAVDAIGRIYLALPFEIRALVPDTGSGCKITASAASLDVPAAGGDFKVSVSASGYLCPYAVQASAPWVKPNVGGASGSGSVTLSIDANTGGARQSTVTIGAAAITVKQAGTPLAIGTAAALPDGKLGAAYSVPLAAIGGTPPYTWSVLSGTLPSGLTLSQAGIISGTPTAPGTTAFTVWVTDSSATTASQPFTLSISSTVTIAAVVNAASGVAGSIAPGEIVVIYGSGLGPPALAGLTLSGAGLVDTQVAGTTVLFDGTAAPLIYTSAGQVAAVVPYGVTSAHPQVLVRNQGQPAAPFSTTLAAAAPALFTADASGKGQAAMLNENGSYNGPGQGAKAGSTVTLFATGEGQTSPAGVDGKPASLPLPAPVLPVTVRIGGQPAKVVYAGGAPGEVAGVMQVNVEIPAGIAPGDLPVVIQVGTVSSRSDVTLRVE